MRIFPSSTRSTKHRIRKLRVEPLEQRRLLAADLRITEFMADNAGAVLDGDGGSPDWIELFNTGADAADLDGWYLTDDPADLNKWPLPAETLGAGSAMLVFASGQSTDDYVDAGGYRHANFRLDVGGEYLALVEGETVRQEFAPEYPDQEADVSYGLGMETESIIDQGSPLEYLVPADDSLEPAWRLPGFDDPSLIDSEMRVTSSVLLSEIGTGAIDSVEIQNVAGRSIDTAGWVVAVNNADAPTVTDYASAIQAEEGLVAYWRLGEQPVIEPRQQLHGEPVVDRTAPDAWQGGAVFNARLPDPGWGEDSKVVSFTFFNNDATRDGLLITPLLLQDTGGGNHVIHGIGTTRTVTAGGLQAHPFELQAGVDTFDPAAGSFHIGVRYGNTTTSNQGVVEYGDGGAAADSWTFYGNGNSDQGPIAVGSAMPNKYGTILNRDYSLEFTIEPASGGGGEQITAVDQMGNHDGLYSVVGVEYGQSGAVVGDADTAVGLAGGDVVVPADPAFDFGGAAMTLEGWVQVDAIGAYQWIVAKDTNNNPATPGLDYLLGMEPGGRFTFYSQGLANNALSIEPAAADGQTWYHVVGVQDPTAAELTLYVNGQLQQTVPLSTSGVTSPDDLAIGDRTGGTGGQQFPGTIDEVAIYDRVLSTAEIQQHYFTGRALLAGGVDQVNPVVWQLPDQLTADEVLYRTDDAADNYWGSDLQWSDSGPGWAMIVNDQGGLVDFAAWGYTQQELDGVAVRVREFEIELADGWSGGGAASSGTDTTSLQRAGDSDTGDTGDWSWQLADLGARNPGLTVPFPAETVPLVGPIGYAQEGVFDGEGETVGPDVIARPTTDGASGGIFLLDNFTFGLAAQVSEWSFYSANTLQVTPLIFSKDGTTFEIVGVGQTRTSDGNGVQTYPFELVDGTDLVEPGYYLGFKDGSNTVNNTGVIGFDNNTGDSIRYFGGGHAGNVVAGGQLPGGTAYPRTYSVQMSTVSNIQGEVVTDVEAEMLGNATSLYVRYPFTLAAADIPASMTLQVRYDDGFVAYLNGTQVATSNAPDPIAFDSAALGDRPLGDVRRFESIGLSDHIGLLNVGENVLAVHLLNDAIDSPELLLDVRLVSNTVADPPELGYFDTATPESPNGLTFAGFVADTRFSVDRGFYVPEDFNAGGILENGVTVTSDTPGATIVYTLDGSEPTLQNGTQVPAVNAETSPAAVIDISQTTILRAAAFKGDFRPTNVDTQTYLFVDDVVDQSLLAAAVADGAEMAAWGPEMQTSLLALPTVSIVTQNTLSQTEREISMELIYPDGTQGFQVDAGVEHFGGHSLGWAKKNMRISFKRDYGPVRLNYDVFEDGGIDRFDQLILRTGSHDTMFWTYPSNASLPPDGVYVRGRWAFDQQLEMGQPAPRGRYVHVYLNGIYHGQHHLMERPNAAFMAEIYGGDKADYDAINKGTAIDGDLQAWNAMVGVAGNYESLRQYLDVENYADYMLLQFYGGNTWDWRPAQNWMAAGRFPKDENGTLLTDAQGNPDGESVPFKFFAWDSDVIVRTPVTHNAVGLAGPGSLWPLVSQHAEFMQMVADRAQKYFFNDGQLTPDAVQTQFDTLKEKIEISIIAETARWGHTNWLNTPLPQYTPDTWQDALDRMETGYFPLRTDVVIEQMRDAGYYPSIDAPAFAIDGVAQHGGAVGPGDLLTMTSETTITSEDTVLVAADHPVLAFVPTDGSLEPDVASPAWFETGFIPAGWLPGTGGVGYEDTASGYDTLIGLDIQAAWDAPGAASSAYTRFGFTLDAQFNGAEFDTLTLDIQYDDGFVAYLNGTEVASRFAPETPAWNSVTDGGGQAEPATESIDLTGFLHLLGAGDNLLAIRGLNVVATSSDMLIRPELVLGKTITATSAPIYFTTDGSDPRLPGGAINNADVGGTALAYTGPIALDETVGVKARALDGTNWSALSEARFVLEQPAAPGDLIITEINYNPLPPTPDEQTATTDLIANDDFEFIELVNTRADTGIDLAGVRFIQGVEFDFTGSNVTTLAPGRRVLIVRHLEAFQARYPTVDVATLVAGQYGGGLKNGGELVGVVGADDAVLQWFDYDDNGDWPDAADAGGSSLELVTETSDPIDPLSWHDSVQVGGSPGDAAAPAVIGRHVFYDGSSYDDGTPEGNDAAIAADKQALMPGRTATADNYTSFGAGLNGLMIDLAHAEKSTPIGLADFAFAAGNDDAPGGWSPTATPSFDVRHGAGAGGSDRVVVTWGEGILVNGWLQATVHGGGSAVGLTAPDVFYFGNAPGESGNSAADALVNATDVILARDNPRGTANPATMDDTLDFNRDGAVDVLDMILARNNATSPLSALRRITV